jgi:hypothetical protein
MFKVQRTFTGEWFNATPRGPKGGFFQSYETSKGKSGDRQMKNH